MQARQPAKVQCECVAGSTPVPKFAVTGVKRTITVKSLPPTLQEGERRFPHASTAVFIAYSSLYFLSSHSEVISIHLLGVAWPLCLVFCLKFRSLGK